ncbi:MAG: hypothetical protein WAM00_10930 [Salegentibacter sp.]
MKKIVFLFVCSLVMMSCSVEADGPNLGYDLAVVKELDLPEYFEMGKIYDIEVTFTLPSACHNALTPSSLDVRRGGNTGDLRRQIYVAAVTSYDADQSECNVEEEDLDKTQTFRLLVDEEEDFTFHLWTGVDEDGKSVYTEVTVPVGAPEDNTSNQ